MDTVSEVDAGRNNAVETSDVSNLIEYCQPCKEQENEKEAVYWCINCTELLCANCHGHHKVLKATRGHKMLSIDDYHMIGTSIAELESHCQMHQSMELQFFCVTHNTPCCTTCKVEKHDTGCDLQLKEDILKIANIRGDMNATIEAMTKMTENMRSDLLNDHWNALDLEKQKALYYDEMKNGRQRVEDFLDEVENDAKVKFESAFRIAHGALLNNKRKIEHRLNVVQKRTETAVRIKECDFSEFKMFLIMNKIKTEYKEEQRQIDFFLSGMKDVSVVAQPIYDLNQQEKQITFSNGFETRGCFSQSHIGKKQLEFDDIEFSSSTVEAEGDISEENALPEKDIPPDEAQTIIENIMADNQAEDGTLEENVLSKRDIPPDGVQTTTKNSMTDKPDNIYMQDEHFFIERRNKDISVRCVRFLSIDTIVLTEDSNPRVLVYKTNGYKVGQVEFEEGPDEIAVIDETQVAVSVNKKVVFVDTDDMETGKEKYLRDVIRGLSYADNKLFACLQHRGVLVMGLSGNVLRTIPFIKGKLYICCPNEEMIYSLKCGLSKTLQCYDINRNRKALYLFECLRLINGISCDKDGNIYIAIAGTEIVKYDVKTSAFVSLLTVHDGIQDPYNIDCFDNGNRLLTIDHGREVKIFQKLNC